MLSQDHRLRRRADFARTLRRGVHAGRATLVVHLLVEVSDRPARCGFVVSKAVGSAVVRNAVKRRLRELMRERMRLLAPGSLLVVRARPAAAHTEHRTLATDLDGALDGALRRVGRRSVPSGDGPRSVGASA